MLLIKQNYIPLLCVLLLFHVSKNIPWIFKYEESTKKNRCQKTWYFLHSLVLKVNSRSCTTTLELKSLIISSFEHVFPPSTCLSWTSFQKNTAWKKIIVKMLASGLRGRKAHVASAEWRKVVWKASVASNI